MNALARLRALVAALPVGGSVTLSRDALAELLADVDVIAPEDYAQAVEDVRHGFERLAWPDAVQLADLAELAGLEVPTTRRALLAMARAVGYGPVNCPSRFDGRWLVNGSPVVILARLDLSDVERMAAARKEAGDLQRLRGWL